LMDVVMEFVSDGLDPVERSAWSIMVGVGVLFVVSTFARAVFTYFFNDPAKHANKFGIAASDVMVSSIEASAMKSFESMLDRVGVDIAWGHWGEAGPDAAVLLGWGTEVFSGAVFRAEELRRDEAVNPLVRRLGEQAAAAREGFGGTRRS